MTIHDIWESYHIINGTMYQYKLSRCTDNTLFIFKLNIHNIIIFSSRMGTEQTAFQLCPGN